MFAAIDDCCKRLKCPRGDFFTLGRFTRDDKRFYRLLKLVFRDDSACCTCIGQMDAMVQAGAVGRRRAACLATSPFVDSLLFRVLSISVNCDCLLRVINWGTCVHFVYPCAPRLGPIEAAGGPLTCVSFACDPNHVIDVLRDAGCPPWAYVAYKPAVGLVAETDSRAPEKLKPAWHRWHARVGKRLWLALNL